MANLIAVIGDTSTGKSTSTKTLDSKETVILKIINKDLPYKGSRSSYNAENKNAFYLPTYMQVLQAMKSVNQNEKIKNLILDDVGFLMSRELFSRSGETGY